MTDFKEKRKYSAFLAQQWSSIWVEKSIKTPDIFKTKIDDLFLFKSLSSGDILRLC